MSGPMLPRPRPTSANGNRSIESDLMREKFDDLDNMADRYRREKSRLPGGEWRLRLFYAATLPLIHLTRPSRK
jgi:hypothetical protein